MPVIAFAGRIIYVDANSAGANDGSSWSDAYIYLQDALANASYAEKPIEVRVAQGIYKPDQRTGVISGNRYATFQLINDLTIKGGYAGFGHPDPNARDFKKYETILSGDLNGDDTDVNDPCDLLTEPTRAENSYTVLKGENGNDCVLDGLTITGGNTNSSILIPDLTTGGGIYLFRFSLTLLNCTLTMNSAVYGGGAIQCFFSSPKFIGCTFIRNCGGSLVEGDNTVMVNGGGGAANSNCSSVFEQCMFINNWASLGGGLWNTESNVTLICCTFSRNKSHTRGGGIFNWKSDARLDNCIFKANSAEKSGGGIEGSFSNLVLTGCAFAGNTASGDGGGVNNNSCDITLTNCVFGGNSAKSTGGAIYQYKGSMTLINCTHNGNRARENGGAIYLEQKSSASIMNCILWGDTPQEIYLPLLGGVSSLTYSNIQDGWPGVTNMSVDPCFVNPGYWDPNGTPDDPNDDFWIDGDYHLKSQAGRWEPLSGIWVKDDVTSPCIDEGDPNSPIGLEPFPNGGIINMGAYGGTAEASNSYFGKPVCETIIVGDINGDCKVDFKDFQLMAVHWLEQH
jgi:hypothetical protein